MDAAQVHYISSVHDQKWEELQLSCCALEVQNQSLSTSRSLACFCATFTSTDRVPVQVINAKLLCTTELRGGACSSHHPELPVKGEGGSVDRPLSRQLCFYHHRPVRRPRHYRGVTNSS